ncbi:hypothetical protein HYH02_011299 [Chlamydomonas schloesseri]|uniref:UDENN domain-containing protein n=1 Tax=Chlamydomonas schloesseri TaxID=2026947 RepID=A0A835W635_9CHLO|nr:hypothetical protein HYH02_011299 [Chlamydomonas schloesseri]|eukprot:KAG2437036.1 hypothetical protein HYH02_011299 [Chlamydomonas schloesseri]
MKTEPVFEAFAVVGLALPLSCVSGEDVGLRGMPTVLERTRFRPALLDQLQLSSPTKLPSGLPTCCMPDGVELISPTEVTASVKPADLGPKLYAVVLTDEGGRRLYVSCLSYMDAVPPAAACEQLAGWQASRALCLVSRWPYLATAEQVLRRLYVAVFCLGPSAPVADLVASLLRLSRPLAPRIPEVRFVLEGRPFVLRCPDAMDVPRNGEVSLRPLLEVLSPTNAMLILLAVLLERRVALVSGQMRLTTLVAEAIMQLLWPFRYQHVYVPLVPVSLLDLLEAPTPFLMGIGGHSGSSLGAELAGEGGGAGAGTSLAARVHEGLVVADLDRNRVYNSADLRPSLEHPAAAQLLACLSHLVQPVAHDAGGLAEEEPVVAGAVSCEDAAAESAVSLRGHAAGTARNAVRAPGDRKGQAIRTCPDPWLHVVRVAASSGWGPGHDALVRRLFLRFFSVLLRGYHQHLPPARASGSSSGANGVGPDGDAPPPRSSRPSPSGPPYLSADFLQRHVESHGPKSRPLLSQLLGTQGWYVMLDEWCDRTHNPYGWYRVACSSCRTELPLELAPPGDGAADPLGDGEGAADGAREAGSGAGAAATAAFAPEQGARVAAAPGGSRLGEARGAAGAEGRHGVVVAVIGLPSNADAAEPRDEDAVEAQQPAPTLPAGRRVCYCRPCPLLQRRRPPVYRTFPALHLSDEPYAAAAAGAASAAAAQARLGQAAPSSTSLGPSPAASAAMWQAWQAHVMPPPGARGHRDASSGGGGGGAGGGTAGAVPQSSGAGVLVGGVEADGAAVGAGGDAGGSRGLSLRQWQSGPRITRSLSSDNLSGELASGSLGGDVGKPPQRQRSSIDGTGSSTSYMPGKAAAPPSVPTAPVQGAASTNAGGGHGHGLPHPSTQRSLNASAAGDAASLAAAGVPPTSAAAASPFATALGASLSLRNVLRGASIAGAMATGLPPAGGGGAGPSAAAGSAAAAAAAATSAASSVGSILPPPGAAAAAASSRTLASYKAEQELVRQQLAALTQVLAWGPGTGVAADKAGTVAGAGAGTAVGAAPAPAAAAAAAAPGGRLPSRAEMDRLRQLLCVQTAGSGAFLVGRLRDEVFGGGGGGDGGGGGGGGTGAAASPSAASGISAMGAGGAAAPLQAGVRTPVGAGGAGLTAAAEEAAAGATGGAGGGGGGAGRCVHWAAFEVLAEALDAVVTAAVGAGEFGVLGAALEVAMATYTYTGKGKVLLLHRLTTNPYLYTRAAWSGIFCHTLLAAAMAAAAGGSGGGGGGVEVEPPAAKSPAGASAPAVTSAAGPEAPAAGAGGAAAVVLPQSEYLRRQRVLLQALQRSLSAQACWMMHLGVGEEPAWELVTGMVAAARVADLPAEGGQLHRLLLNVRAAMRAARAAASHQHRRRMPDPGCSALPYPALGPAPAGLSLTLGLGVAAPDLPYAVPLGAPPSPRRLHGRGATAAPSPGLRQGPLPPPVTPHLSFRDSGQSGGGGSGSGGGLDIQGAGAAAPAAAASTAGGVSSPQTPARTGLGAAAGGSPVPLAGRTPPGAAAAGGALTGEAAGRALAARALAASAAAAGTAAYGSPRSTAGSVRSMATAGGGGGAGRERPYRVQYERLLAIAASGGRLATVSGERSPTAAGAAATAAGGGGDVQPPPPSPERRLGRSGASITGGKPAKDPHVQSAAAAAAALSLGGRGRAPIMCLAAASGVVLAAPRLPHYHLLALQPEGGLRATARLPLGHLLEVMAPGGGGGGGGSGGGGVYVDAAVLSADGATAAISVAPLPPPPRHRAAAAAALAPQQLGPMGQQQQPQQQQQPLARLARVVALVDVAAERTVRELRPASGGRTTALHMSPTANLLATGCAGSWARLWDIRASAGAGSSSSSSSSTTTATAATQPRVASSAAVSLATGQGGVCALLADSGRLRLYSGGRDGSVLEWDLRKPNAPLVAYRGHSGWVTSLALLPSSSALGPAATATAVAGHSGELLLVSAGTDWTVRVWNPRDATAVAAVAAPPPQAPSAPAAAGSGAPHGPGVSGGGGAGGGRGAGRPSSGGSGSGGRPSSQGGGGGGGAGGGRSRAWTAGARGGAGAAPGAAGGPLPTAAAAGGAAAWGPGRAAAVCPAAAVLVGHGAPVSALAVDQAAGLIYSGSRDGMLAAWTPDGACAAVRRHHGGAVRVIAPYASAALNAPTINSNSSGGGRQGCPLVTCGGDGSAALWGGFDSAAGRAAGEPAGAASGVPEVLSEVGGRGVSGGGAEEEARAAAVWGGAAGAGGGGGGGWCGTEAGPLAAFHAASLTRAAAWDAARGVLVVGDDRGVVRAWAPPLHS